ncbi:hypothetical protein F4777DRAFT_553205 [Nemania sp. FL0916]|nr:hypothetical protein F4777DRAFT_553205 [Nemania sp. FL0916]
MSKMHTYEELFCSAPWTTIQDLRLCMKSIRSSRVLDGPLTAYADPLDLELANQLDIFELSLRRLLLLDILDQACIEEYGLPQDMPKAVVACLGILCDHLESAVNNFLVSHITPSIRKTEPNSRYPNLRALVICAKGTISTSGIKTLFFIPTAKAARRSYRAIRSCHTNLSQIDRQSQPAQASGVVQDRSLANTWVERQHREHYGQVFKILLDQFSACTTSQPSTHEVLVEAADTIDGGFYEKAPMLNFFLKCSRVDKMQEIQRRPMSSCQDSKQSSTTAPNRLETHDNGYLSERSHQSETLFLCKELKRSWWQNRKLLIQFNEQNFFPDNEDSSSSFKLSSRNLSLGEIIPLETLLRERLFKRLGPSDYRSNPQRYTHSEKRSLAIKLALNFVTD